MQYYYFICIPFLDEPVRKPVTVQDMQVKDSKGRARFHGAFTGGFSAGFFNTVGSKEGTELHFWMFFRYLKIAKFN